MRGERVCLFMDRLPELYIGFLGVLKAGLVVQPLFSAFGEESLSVRLENAETACVITEMKHVRKVRRIRESLPHLRHVIVVDGADKDLKDGESALTGSRYDPQPSSPTNCVVVWCASPKSIHVASW